MVGPRAGARQPGCEDDMGEGGDVGEFVTVVPQTEQKGLDLRIPRVER